jgi:hypothetical protein
MKFTVTATFSLSAALADHACLHANSLVTGNFKKNCSTATDSTDALNTLPVLARSGSEQSQILMSGTRVNRLTPGLPGAAFEGGLLDLLGIAWQIFRCADSTADVMIAEDIAGADNHEDRSLWLLVRSPNRQDIDNHMVMRLPRDAGIQVLKQP